MDSLRLGQDAMMYHVEQGSQITRHGGQLPDPYFIPAWASRVQDPGTIHVHSHALAECQGCIAEQNIEHTCSLKIEKKPNEGSVQIHESHEHCHSCCPHHEPQHAWVGGQPSSKSPASHHEHQRAWVAEQRSSNSPASSCQEGYDHIHEQDQHLDQPLQQKGKEDSTNDTARLDQSVEVRDQSNSGATDEAPSSAPSQGRNTWPFKRQLRQVAHVGSIFQPGAEDGQDRPGGEAQSVGTMFFVAFDDSVCNSSNSASSNQGRQQLPPHKTNNSLVPDLVSVTRETWGGSTESERVDTSTGSSFTLGAGESRDASEGSQPTSPSYNRRKAWRATPPTQLTGSRSCAMEDANHSRPAYMEIPMRDEDADGDDDCTEETDKSRDDSNANKAAKAKSPSAEVHSPTSFTIDFDGPQHSPRKHLNIGSSLSAFVPSKIRKGFQNRKVMSKEPAPNKNSEERELSPLSDAKVDEIWGKVRQCGTTQVPSGAAPRSPDTQDSNQLTEGVLEKRGSDREAERRDSLRKPVMTSKSPKMSRSFKLHSTSSNDSDPGSPTNTSQSLSIFKTPRSSKLFNHEHDPTGSTTMSQTLSTSITSSRSSKLFSNSSSDPDPRSSTTTCPSLNNPKTSRSSKLLPNSSNEPAPESPTTVPHSLNISKYPNTTSYLIDKMFEGGTPASILHDKPRPRDHQPSSRGDSHHTSEKTRIRPETDSSCSGESPPARLPLKSTKTSQKTIIHDDNDDDDLRITEDVPVVDEKEDKTSEAGTYTIEADANEGQDAEDEARKRIPEVFGLDLDSLNLERPNIDFFTVPDPAAGRAVDDEQDTLLDEDSHSPGDDDTDVHLGNESDDENSDITAIDDIQTWVSQQATITTTTNDEEEAQGPSTTAKTEGDVSLSKKPPQGISRARPGTGRKLPSIPIDSKSPSHSSLPPGHNTPPGSRAAETSKHSTDRNHGASSGSGQAHSKTVNNGYRGNLGSSAPGFKLSHHISAVPFTSSPAHISSRTSNARSSQDSDNETSASSVVLNGDEIFAVPPLYKSPRDYFEKKQQLTKSSSTATSSSANMGKKPLVKSQSHAAAATKSATPPRNPPSAIGFRGSDVSNVSKRKDSIDNDSIISDVGSDNSSKGKPTLTKTRMNKTFELRRARADSLDSQSTMRPKSGSMAKPGHSSTLNKPNSLSSSLRNKNLFDSERVPTGALAARRSLNIPPEDLHRPAKAAVSRTDSGLHSPGLQRASSLATSHPALGSKRELTPKLHHRSTPTGRTKLSLANFAGITNRSQSQPNSRSNSPKSAEKIAWERRKGYDARKSVAEAKASKTKDTGQPSGTIIRAKPLTSSSSIRNMTRSASFTNSAGLSHGLRSSTISSSQEFSHPRDSHHHQHPDPCRAFIPIHSSQQNGKSPNSADEYDTLGAAHIVQESTTSLMLLQEAPSAFTPPLLLRNKSVTPDSSSPSEPSLSLRRRTLNMDGQSSPHFVRAAKVNGDGGGGGGYVGHSSARHLPQASYDTLIVSSVYQLSQKLRTSTDNALNKLRHQHRISQTPPPSDDYLSDSGRSEITAWKTANQELASTLKNLRTLERQVQMMQTALFTDVDVDNEAAAEVPEHKQKRLEDMERKYGFQPIEQPASHHHQVEEAEIVSPEIVELSGQFT